MRVGSLSLVSADTNTTDITNGAYTGFDLIVVGSGFFGLTVAERVASPGGTTRAGLSVLDSEDRLRRLIQETFAAAVRREQEMRAAARGPAA